MCSPIGTSPPTVRAYTVSYTIVLASRARVGARADNDLGKVSRVKKNCLSNTVMVSRARVGARAEVTKNDLEKVSRKNNLKKKRNSFLPTMGCLSNNLSIR